MPTAESILWRVFCEWICWMFCTLEAQQAWRLYLWAVLCLGKHTILSVSACVGGGGGCCACGWKERKFEWCHMAVVSHRNRTYPKNVLQIVVTLITIMCMINFTGDVKGSNQTRYLKVTDAETCSMGIINKSLTGATYRQINFRAEWKMFFSSSWSLAAAINDDDGLPFSMLWLQTASMWEKHTHTDWRS